MASGAGRAAVRSAIDWTKFASLCPKNQVDIMRATKAKHESFVNKVYSLPENLPKIDFATYKPRLKDPGMADRFEKAYAALSIPYPVDKENLIAKVEADAKAKSEEMKKYKAELQVEIDFTKSFLKKLGSVPDIDDMTLEMMNYYFPETWQNPDKPTFWPHNEAQQPYNPDFKLIK